MNCLANVNKVWRLFHEQFLYFTRLKFRHLQTFWSGNSNNENKQQQKSCEIPAKSKMPTFKLNSIYSNEEEVTPRW